MMYVAARHTSIDCWEKRRRKGYLFIIGDEMAYPAVKFRQVNQLMGGALQTDVPLAQIIDEVRQRYHLYFIIPGGAAHGSEQPIVDFWQRHVGAERVIILDQPEDTSETIALLIGVNEGAITPDQGIQRLRHRGAVARTIERLAQTFSSLFGVGSAPTPGKSDGSRWL
jgi:hypothetical protein